MPAALRIAAAPVSKPDEAACPVAALAARAATVLRGYYSLMNPDQEFAPKPPFPIPNLRDSASKENEATPEGIAKRFRDELYAIAAFAAFETPSSNKGVLFQLYLAANTAGYIQGDLHRSKIPDDDWTSIEEAEERSKRLLFNALEVLDADTDDDLKLLRRWFFDDEWEREIRGAYVLNQLKKRRV